MPLLRTGTEDIQWKLVGTGRQERKDQWKRERCAHQAPALRYSSCEQSRCLCQWREISVYETVTCADCSSVQSTNRIGSFRRQRIDATSRIPLDRFESQTAWNKELSVASGQCVPRTSAYLASRCNHTTVLSKFDGSQYRSKRARLSLSKRGVPAILRRARYTQKQQSEGRWMTVVQCASKRVA